MRPRRVAQAARAAAAARLAQGTTPPTHSGPPSSQALLGARLAIIAAATVALTALLVPDAAESPLLRTWILQALEHANGGDPRLLVAADTPYGAVLPNPLSDAGWGLLAAAWTWFGTHTFLTLAALACVAAVAGWGWLGGRAWTGAAAGVAAVLVAQGGVHTMGALAFGLLGLGALLLHRTAPAPLALATGPLWAAAAALDPSWAWVVPVLAVALSYGRALDTRGALAASLFCSALVLGGHPWLVQAWMVAATLPLIPGLPVAPRTRIAVLALSTMAATAAALMALPPPSNLHTTWPTDPTLWVIAGAVGALVTGMGIRAWRARHTPHPTPTLALLTAGTLAATALVTFAHTAPTHGVLTTPGTPTAQDACTAADGDIDALLAWMDDTDTRRLAAPPDLAWRLLVRDAELLAQGGHTGISVVDAGLYATPTNGDKGDAARLDNARIVEAARQGTLKIGNGTDNTPQDNDSAEPDPAASYRDYRDETRGGSVRTEPGADAYSQGTRAAWKRSVGAVALCGDVGSSGVWGTIGAVQVGVVQR